MVTKTNQGEVKKTSRGMKQESHKTGVPVNQLKKKVRQPKVPKTKKEA